MHIDICMLHLQSHLEWGVPIEIENPAAHNRRCQSDGVGERQKCGGLWCWGKSCKKCCISQGELPQRVKTKRVCVLDHVEFVSVALVATKLRHSVLQRLVSRWTNEKVKEIPTKKKTNTPARTRNTHTRTHTEANTRTGCVLRCVGSCWWRWPSDPKPASEADGHQRKFSLTNMPASQQQQQQQRLVQGVAGPTPSYGQPLSSVSCSTQQNRTKRKFEKIQKAKQRKKFLQRIAAALSLSGSPSSFSFFLCYSIALSQSHARSSPLTTLTLALTSSKTFGRAKYMKEKIQNKHFF